MASDRQIAANRSNGAKGGPKTETGKLKTRCNARRDGITGQVITLPESELPIFDSFKRKIVADLKPETTFETVLADGIAWDTWRLNTARAVEMNLLTIGAQNADLEITSDNPQIDAAMGQAVACRDKSKDFARLSLQEQRLKSSIRKDLATLRSLQAERKQQYQQDLEDEMLRAQAHDFNEIPYAAPNVPGKFGSVFSTSQVKAAVNRKTMLVEANRTVIHSKHRLQYPGAWENQDPIKPNSGLRVASAA